MKKCYIAGPMSGYPGFNFMAFYSAEDEVEKLGYFPINPARIDNATGFDEKVNDLSDIDMKEVALRDIVLLMECEAVYLLDGWEDSRGALAEYFLAKWIGLEIIKQKQ
jgi:hypothetical protein